MSMTARVPLDVMRPIKDAFNARYPGLQAYMRRITNMASQQVAAGERPHIRTSMGRYLPAESHKLYSLVNFSIQGEAAEALKRGILDLDAAGLGDCLRLPVHDEVVLEVPEGEAEDALRLVEKTLTDREQYRVPLTWSGSIMPARWIKE
jgi:DNA polymerase-1